MSNLAKQIDLEALITAALRKAQDCNYPDVLGSRELSLAITKLEEAKMWAEKIPIRGVH